MSSSPAPVCAVSDATTDATDAARTHEVHFEPPVLETPESSRSQAQQGDGVIFAAMSSSSTPVLAARESASDAATDAARTYEDHFEPPVLETPESSRCQAQQGNGVIVSCTPSVTISTAGFVDAVIPRRRGIKEELVLTRELLEGYYHEPLDNVVELLQISKTTIKNACRRLGLPRWPYSHKGVRHPRVRVSRPAQDADSEQARTLKATFHELMGNTDTRPSADNTYFKRQRVGDEQMAQAVVQGVPLTSFSSGTTLAALQEMQLQSVAALQQMVTALSQSDYQLALNAAVQGPAFAGQVPPPWMPVSPSP